jgi:TatD DNase family protein
MIIDTHCHLYKEYYDDLEKLFKNMYKKNIYAINNGCDYKSNVEVIDVSKKNKNIFAAIGIHPTEINNSKEYVNFIKSNINNVVAIGEIGLDYYYDKSNKEEQIKIFTNQLNIAQEFKLPVIIHNREATEDILSTLKGYKLNGVIHAFSGSYETAQEFIKLGYKIGVGGIITFKNSKLKDVIKKIDIKDIVLETDSPYLTPEPNRGKKNDPTNLEYVAKYIAEIKNINYEDVINITTNTTITLFDLDI